MQFIIIISVCAVHVEPFLCKSVMPATAVGMIDTNYSAAWQHFGGRVACMKSELVKVRVLSDHVPRITSFLTWNAGNNSKGQYVKLFLVSSWIILQVQAFPHHVARHPAAELDDQTIPVVLWNLNSPGCSFLYGEPQTQSLQGLVATKTLAKVCYPIAIDAWCKIPKSSPIKQ